MPRSDKFYLGESLASRAARLGEPESDSERVRRNRVIAGLLQRLDSHSPGEARHARRVAVYAVATGEELGLGQDQLLEVRYAADLHDIGKLDLPKELLAAPRPLTQDERAVIERHVGLAENYLLDEPFLAAIIPLVASHHERWDGQGYARSKRGEEIPLGSRIVAVAEAFDTMISPPDWRTPFSTDAALAAVLGLSGTWFDPQVCEAFADVQSLIQPHGA